jgi:hypothetical protein
MTSLKVLQENTNCNVAVKPNEKYVSSKEKMTGFNSVNKVPKKSLAKADKDHKEFLAVMSLLDCLENSMKVYEQAEYFL